MNDLPKLQDSDELGKHILSCYVNKESGIISSIGRPKEGFFHDAEVLGQLMGAIAIYSCKSAEMELGLELTSEEFTSTLSESFSNFVSKMSDMELDGKKVIESE